MRVLVGSSSAVALWPTGDRDGSAAVELVTDDGLRAKAIVHEKPGSSFGGLGRFFALLAEDWRGWSGSRRWSSLEDQLVIDASHDGHVRLRIELRASHESSWVATCFVTLEPGEQLTAAARDVRRFTADC